MHESREAQSAVTPDARVAREREAIQAARQRGRLATAATYARLSGPGWLQSAITLGGGSLASSLYLGVLGGAAFLWLQPLAMALGVVMLSAIGYVTLTTGERPFGVINRHVNPVLGWGWALASLVASVVWCLPQFSLGAAAVQQNLLTGVGEVEGKLIGCALILVVAVAVIWLYDSGRRGLAAFEVVLKVMVALIVIAFFGVVYVLTREGGLDWGAVGAGFVPDLSLLWQPAETLRVHLEGLGAEAQAFWSQRIVSDQRQVMISAAATAVGINMTFLLPYSMLARGWRREFRGLAAFDLATGLLVPFVLATSCVVVAAGARFHATPDARLVQRQAEAPTKLQASYDGLLQQRIAEVGAPAAAAEGSAALDALPLGEREVASMLVRRDAFDLARALEPLTGEAIGRYVFGLGVLGMAMSTVIVLMLISGFCVCEMLGVEPRGRARRLGSLLPLVGVLGPFVWADAQFWLAVPTSVFGFTLLPIAYLTFFLLLNSRRVLGDQRPAGAVRVVWNSIMLVALVLVSVGAGWAVWTQAGWIGVSAVAAFVGAMALAHRRR